MQRTHYDLLTQLDPGAVWISAALLALMILVLAVVGLAGARPPAVTGDASGGGWRTFLRLGRRCGLTESERRVLEYLLQVGHTRLATALFDNHGLLDGVLQRGIDSVHGGRLALLLSIKARIETAWRGAVRSSSSIPAGTRISVVPAVGGGYPSRVLAGVGYHLACLVPRDESGDEIHWRRGARVRVEHRRGGAPSTFCSVVGYGSVGDRSALLLADTRTIPAAQPQSRLPGTRATARRCRVLPIAVSPVRVAGRVVQRATVLTAAGTVCTLLALAAGRARIRGPAPAAAGSLVTVEVAGPQAGRTALYGKLVPAAAVQGRCRQSAVAGVFDVHLSRRSRDRLDALAAA